VAGAATTVHDMRAVVLDEYGGPEVLHIREVPDPVPGPDEVLVDIVSTALNRAEVLQRMGHYPAPAPAPPIEIPGLEFAGHVSAIGERVIRWRVGDAVMGIVAGGGHAERVAVHERQCLRVPAGISLHDAGAIPEVWVTAHDALVTQGAMAPGANVLVHAGASGVGSAAIQLAKAWGATVLVTASTAKVDACRALGADIAIDYTTTDYVPAVLEYTEGRGVDVILDVIGGDYLERNVRVIATGGRIVQVGVMGGGKVTFNLGLLMPKRASIIGTVLRARPLEEKIAATLRFERQVLPGFDAGRFAPVLDRRYPLDAIADAHRHMETNTNVGKIVLDVQPPS
jgi:NADPH2:quinone reductase